MNKIEYEVKNEISNCEILDVCLYGDKMLETQLNNKKMLRNVQFKYYNSNKVDEN